MRLCVGMHVSVCVCVCRCASVYVNSYYIYEFQCVTGVICQYSHISAVYLHIRGHRSTSLACVYADVFSFEVLVACYRYILTCELHTLYSPTRTASTPRHSSLRKIAVPAGTLGAS